MDSLLTNKTVEKLKYDMVREKLISYENLSFAEDFARAEGINLALAFIKKGFIEEKTLLEFVEEKLHIPFVNLEDYSLDPNCLNYISEQNARKHKLIPLFKIENVLTIAMADPMDLFVINSIINELELEIEPIICSETSIITAINQNYSSITSSKALSENNFNWSNEIINENISETQIKKIINDIFSHAAYKQVHNILFEASSQGLRVDFEKQNVGTIPFLLVPRFISELKNLTNLDNKVHDLPQLGKYGFCYNNSNFTAVISTFPTTKGERLSIKLFKPPPKLDEFEFLDNSFEKIFALIKKPGINIIMGPDNGGKTLFVYSLISELSYEKKVMTIESKVKYDLENISQCEINEDTGFNLEKVFSHLNLQHSDVIYIENICKEKDFDNLNALVNQNKTVITELREDSCEDAASKFDKINGISSRVFVSDKNKVRIV